MAAAAQQLDASCDGVARLLAVRADAADLIDPDHLTDRIGERRCRLDGAFANAGAGVFQRTAEVTERDLDHTVDVNIKGTFFTLNRARAALPLPDAAGGGSMTMDASCRNALAGVWPLLPPRVRAIRQPELALAFLRAERDRTTTRSPAGTRSTHRARASAEESQCKVNE
ncbi:SDR family NAD(P)-dependent oxidoreductase [Streptomyces sp. ISL-66]|nr:SDR family NAD(P)-dependent oxidoreductase [Streptomyces sp. ISL-66]